MPAARRWGKKLAQDNPSSQDVKDGHTQPEKNREPAQVAVKVSQVCHWYENRQNHEATLSLRDNVPLPDLAPVAIEYRHRLRAMWMHQQGRCKAEVAKELGRPEGWVTSCWNMTAEQIKRPREVAKYIAEYETRMLKEGVEPFCPPSLRRRYMSDSSGMYEECAAGMPWRQAVLRKRNYETGEVTITKVASNRQDCTFPNLKTGIPRLDVMLQKVKEDFQINDPGAYVICNWYPDGNTNIAPHQHDFWSAILSFGAPRVFTLDWNPLLLGDGDLLVFGTQRHSVPKMPSVKEGRLSVAIFWYPERRHADASFNISLDPSIAEAALANGSLQDVLTRAALQKANTVKIDTGGRGVGRYEDDIEADTWDDDDGEDSGFLSEERLMEIALQVSMLEQ